MDQIGMQPTEEITGPNKPLNERAVEISPESNADLAIIDELRRNAIDLAPERIGGAVIGSSVTVETVESKPTEYSVENQLSPEALAIQYTAYIRRCSDGINAARQAAARSDFTLTA